ncbi:MAG: hypothetical protein HPY76_01425 [Anaerolineae bacterium]|nr:hypothetical protein [Anaerolineae bacterium]
MSKPLRFIQIALIALGVIMLYFGINRQPTWLAGLGLLLLSGGVALFGVRDIYYLQASEWDQTTHRERTYTGIGAILGGVFTLMLAAGSAAAGLVLIFGAWDAFWDYLKARPGVALLLLGMALLSGGVKYLLGAKEDRSTRWDIILRSLPERVLGAVMGLIGLASLIAGAVEVLFPAGFDRLLARLF